MFIIYFHYYNFILCNRFKINPFIETNEFRVYREKDSKAYIQLYFNNSTYIHIHMSLMLPIIILHSGKIILNSAKNKGLNDVNRSSPIISQGGSPSPIISQEGSPSPIISQGGSHRSHCMQSQGDFVVIKA